jgi:DNA topoisomerase IB
MRLRHSDIASPGITRKRRGTGFSYYDPSGGRITDEATLERIRQLVIPPAWRKVWISPHRNGHIQAVGTDAAGRRQYRYHDVWQQERTEEKFDRVLQLSSLLPDWRRRIATDLSGRGLHRDRVLALALHLIDRGYFRAGGDEYAQDNDSCGLATLRCEHVTVRAGTVVFDYPAKSGVQRYLELTDPRVVKLVRAQRRGRQPDERFLFCRGDSGCTELHADDLNARFKEDVGEEYSVKDLRTWHGTVLAAAGFAAAPPPDTKTAVQRSVAVQLLLKRSWKRPRERSSVAPDSQQVSCLLATFVGYPLFTLAKVKPAACLPRATDAEVRWQRTSLRDGMGPPKRRLQPDHPLRLVIPTLRSVLAGVQVTLHAHFRASRRECQQSAQR